MKYVLYLTMLLAGQIGCPASAQLAWHQGEATLQTGITIRGDLCYQPNANTLLFRQASTWRTYPASQVQCFSFVDKTASAYYHFSVYAVAQNRRDDPVFLIFKELTPGFAIRLVQLEGSQAGWLSQKYDLPQTQKPGWQTSQPCYQ